MRGSVEETLNELQEAEAEKLTQATRYERNEARQGYRSGHYDRNLTTTSGDVTLHVPRLKGVSFETAIIERYRRRESSVAEALETVTETTSIQIVNIEKVILPEEKEALDALPVAEQMLTFLSVIGFEEQVNAAMDAGDGQLSPEAEALKEQIQARIAEMDEAEYAEFEATLMECFPQETVVIDGVEYSFFVLELEVRSGDEVHYERFGFRREGDEWIFARLEIGEQESA